LKYQTSNELSEDEIESGSKFGGRKIASQILEDPLEDINKEE
jgi:hypothetical protein